MPKAQRSRGEWKVEVLVNRLLQVVVQVCGKVEELRIAIVDWIEGTYHRRRRKPILGQMTSVAYEGAHEVLDKELLVA